MLKSVDVGEVGFHMPDSPVLLRVDMFNVLGDAIQIRCPTLNSGCVEAKTSTTMLFGGGFQAWLMSDRKAGL